MPSRSKLCLAAVALITLVSVPWVVRSQAGTPPSLEVRARAVLQRHCARCHASPKDSNDIDFITDLKAVVEHGLVVPKAPLQSPLVCAVARKAGCLRGIEKMPPGDAVVPPSDVEVLVDWVEQGASTANVSEPRPRCPSLDHAEMVEDLVGRDAQDIRYLLLAPQVDRGDPGELDRIESAVRKLLNGLSWRADVYAPAPLPSRRAIRIELSRLEISAKQWEDATSRYPYAAPATDQAHADLVARTGAAHPAVRADWFVHTASRGVPYRTLLGLPPTMRELESQLGLDGPPTDRHALGRSGIVVRQGSRILEKRVIPAGGRYPAAGYYWKTLDFAPSRGPNHARNNLDASVADGYEMIFSLPNGSHAYYLARADGVAIEEGPTSLVRDDTVDDNVVRLASSCFACHRGGLIDEFRERVAPSLRDSLATDNAAYLTASSQWISSADPEPIAAVSRDYTRELPFWQIAAELGLTSRALGERFRDSVPTVLVPSGAIDELSRDTFESSFATLTAFACPTTPPPPTAVPPP